MARKDMLACVLLGLVATVSAQDASAPVAFAPTTATNAGAPNPSASARPRSGQYAADSLATTPTSYNQIQASLSGKTQFKYCYILRFTLLVVLTLTSELICKLCNHQSWAFRSATQNLSRLLLWGASNPTSRVSSVLIVLCAADHWNLLFCAHSPSSCHPRLPQHPRRSGSPPS